MHIDHRAVATTTDRAPRQAALTHLRRPLIRAREWVLLSQTDVVVATYPKTGSTWLQLLLRKLFVDHFQLGDEAIGCVLVNSLRALGRRPRGVPRIYITHGMPGFNDEPYHAMSTKNRRFRRHKVILLAREPKDTLVSLYFHNRYRTVPPAYTGNIEAMVRDDVYGVGKYIRYYQQWNRDRDVVRHFLLVRYEDLRHDPEGMLQKLCTFVGVTGVSNETSPVPSGSAASRTRRRRRQRIPGPTRPQSIEEPEDRGVQRPPGSRRRLPRASERGEGALRRARRHRAASVGLRPSAEKRVTR